MVSTVWEVPGIQAQTSLQMLEQLLNPVCILDDRRQTRYVSPQFLALLPQPIDATNIWDSFLSQSIAPSTLTRIWQAAVLEDKPQLFAFTTDCRQCIECSLQFDSDTKLMFLTAQASLPERQKINQALVRTEAKWKAIASCSRSWLIQISSTGQIQGVNSIVEQALEYSECELLGRHLAEFIHPDQFNQLELALSEWQEPNHTRLQEFESWWRTRSGQWIALSLQGQPWPQALEIDGLIICGSNITDRKVLAQELQASKNQFNALLLRVSGAVFHCDASYTMRTLSDGIEDITGYPAETLIHNQAQSYLSLIHPDDIPLIKDSLIQAIVNRCDTSIEYRLIHADGRVRWVSEQKQGVFDRTSKLLGLNGILLDISDRKQTEANLRRCRAINQSMGQLSPDLVRSNCLESVPDLNFTQLSKNPD